MRLEIKRVAATSLGIVVFSASVASLTYWVAGTENVDLPAGSLGYIFAPAGLALLPGAVLAARLGARLNQSLNPDVLKVLFGVLFLLVGLRLFLANLPVTGG